MVRRRRPSDLAALCLALQEVHAADAYPMIWPQDPVQWLQPPDAVAAWVATGSNTAHRAIVGHVAVVTGIDDEVVSEQADLSGARLASVTRLFVTPSARGRGVGAQLLGVVQTWAKRNSFRLMLDVVDDGGPAIALYERLGWKLVDRRTADWQTPSGGHLPVRIYLAPSIATDTRP